MWALVPLKSPETAKSRLSGALPPARRRELFFSLARHVVTTLMETPGIERVAVVTASAAVAAFADKLGALVVHEAREDGTASAFVTGLEFLQSRKVCDVLMIAGDLPLLSVRAVEAMIAARPAGHGVVIAPDQAGTGTNALLCSPVTAIPPRFGVDSFNKHLAEATARGVTLQVFDDGDFSLDLDVESDLDRLRSLEASGRRIASMNPVAV